MSRKLTWIGGVVIACTAFSANANASGPGGTGGAPSPIGLGGAWSPSPHFKPIPDRLAAYGQCVVAADRDASWNYVRTFNDVKQQYAAYSPISRISWQCQRANLVPDRYFTSELRIAAIADAFRDRSVIRG